MRFNLISSGSLTLRSERGERLEGSVGNSDALRMKLGLLAKVANLILRAYDSFDGPFATLAHQVEATA